MEIEKSTANNRTPKKEEDKKGRGTPVKEDGTCPGGQGVHLQSRAWTDLKGEYKLEYGNKNQLQKNKQKNRWVGERPKESKTHGLHIGWWRKHGANDAVQHEGTGRAYG